MFKSSKPHSIDLQPVDVNSVHPLRPTLSPATQLSSPQLPSSKMNILQSEQPTIPHTILSQSSELDSHHTKSNFYHIQTINGLKTEVENEYDMNGQLPRSSISAVVRIPQPYSMIINKDIDNSNIESDTSFSERSSTINSSPRLLVSDNTTTTATTAAAHLLQSGELIHELHADITKKTVVSHNASQALQQALQVTSYIVEKVNMYQINYLF